MTGQWLNVEGFTIRPWNVGQLALLIQTLIEVANAIKKAGDDEYQIALVFLPHTPKIISVSLDLPIGEIGKWELGKTMLILAGILTVNQKHFSLKKESEFLC